MHVHPPKPLHGWRVFLGEVGIIVFGVLIALTAEHMAERYRWNEEAKEARRSLDEELTGALFAAQERVQMQSCLDKKLDGVDDLIDEGARGIEHRYSAPIRLWGSAVWDSAVASSAVSHMEAHERQRYANLFSFVRTLRDFNYREYQLASQLRTMRPGRGLTDTSRDRLADIVAQLRSSNFILGIGAQQFIEEAKPLHLALGNDARDELKEAGETCTLPERVA